MTGVPHAMASIIVIQTPVDGKEIRTRVLQKLFLLRFANLSDKLKKWIPEQGWIFSVK
jgi:hypothetical protein